MKGKQTGAVLAIGLLILLVLTLIGVSAMRVTVLDERIASNAQFKMLTFQAAESALVTASSLDNVTTFAATGAAPGNLAYEVDLGGANGGALEVVVVTVIEDQGEIPLPGSSMAVGRTGAAALRLYKVEAAATINDQAESVHRLGVGRVVPSAAGR